MLSVEQFPKGESGLIQFKNCLCLRDHALVKEDFWVENGIIKNPEKIFFDERRLAKSVIDAQGAIIAPGFIDIQINGGFGDDFSSLEGPPINDKIERLARNLLQYGVTSFCPTFISCSKEFYHEVLPQICLQRRSVHGANVLGVHLEGPFLAKEKRGAHPLANICSNPAGPDEALGIYSSTCHNASASNDLWTNVAIVTIAPEIPNACAIIQKLTKLGPKVSLGHSMASLSESELGAQSGASCVTHLFNAMAPFNHRDPGLVGVLSSDKIPHPLFFGIVSDGIHVEDAALRIAHKTHPNGLILITDAIAGLGMPDGRHKLGDSEVDISGQRAVIAGTNTLAGSVTTMEFCVHHFWKAARCSQVEALECASLHPAQYLGIENAKGTLNFGSHADFVLLSPKNLKVEATFVGGNLVWSSKVGFRDQ